MALIRGKDGVVTFQATDATGAVTGTATAIAKVSSFEFEETTGTVEAKYMGLGDIEQAASYKRWSATVTAHFDPDDAGQALAANGALVEAVFMPAGSGVGQPSITGKAIITSVKQAQEVENYASFELGLAGTGALVRATL